MVSMKSKSPESAESRLWGTLNWIEALFLLFLAGLAVLPPIAVLSKQLTLIMIAVVQLLEGRMSGRLERHGHSYAVLLKIVLATLLLGQTGDLGINSRYWPIYLVPVVTAAASFGPWTTLFWTALASAAYCSYLIPALQEYAITWEGAAELATRVLFFFLAAMIVNRFAVEIKRRAAAYQLLAEQMAETNRRLAQVQEEARRSERLAALGQMSAGLAHEIRNPLGVIKGSSEMLSKRLQGSDQVTGELAGYISSEVNRLNTIVTRFLDFARPSQLQIKTEAVAPVIDRALKNAHDRWPDAQVQVERQYTPNLPAVPLDADMCEQVFTNLFLNAYEAMGEGGGKLKVTIAATNHDGRHGVEIEIQDTGPGIPGELREQIFNPFFTTKKSGVGLGLSIVSKIVDDHRGWIRLCSEPGKGACFKVFLPSE